MPLLARRASSSGDVNHKPTRKSSFMSLRREKDSKPPKTPTLRTSVSTHFGHSHSSPSSSRRPSPMNSGLPSPADPEDSSSDSPPNQYSFPSLNEPQDSTLLPRIYYRNRSRVSSEHSPARLTIPDFRLSGSTQHTETPPHTPVDLYAYPSESRNFSDVMVAAPISGVETMDALVDGMNGTDAHSSHSTPSYRNSTKYASIPNHHPLYQPPLPKPPPGIVLGGGTNRRQKRPPKPVVVSHSSSEDDNIASASPIRRRRRKRPPSSPTETTAIREEKEVHPFPSQEHRSAYSPIPRPSPPPDRPRTVIPSISEIIRAHTPAESQKQSLKRSSSYSQSFPPFTLTEEPEPTLPEEEADLVSRSSIDSVAEEIQRTLRGSSNLQPTAPVPPSRRLSVLSTDTGSLNSPRSDGASASIYSAPARSTLLPTEETDILASLKPSQTQEVARYLRSARLTTLLKLTRFPHASQDTPLTVSLSDMGNPMGYPVVVFLGLGCVRHIMGLYDEMADCLNLRLIAIDRWGLGKTDQRPKSAKGILQWTSVVEEVLDLLGIEQCSIMAHSAGAPYALAFSNRFTQRVRGTVCLLAPWVGGSAEGGYKWLKYVPNGILRTAQAAEWKVQAWMLGKPPTLAYKGIGYTMEPSKSRKLAPTTNPDDRLTSVYPHVTENTSRPSIGSTFSDYDDLRDFDGRFESKSTLGRAPAASRTASESKLATKRKMSIGFLDRFKGNPSSSPQSPSEEKPPQRKLKALRSMSSLRGKSSSSKKSSEPGSPQLPPPFKFEVGLGLDEMEWSQQNGSNLSVIDDSYSLHNDRSISSGTAGAHSSRRRSLSVSVGNRHPTTSLPPSPAASSYQSSFMAPVNADSSYQAALGNALIAASHSESAKGTHSDLLQILNHDNQPWGFSYSEYPHRVRVWYGEKDEKIAENAVRWMERSMGPENCSVKMVPGADHGLMYKSSVVVDVLEFIAGFWKQD